MSTGIVVCSACYREIHQDAPMNGPEAVENGWRHCEDKTPRCAGAFAQYPDTVALIKGRWCGRDAPARKKV